MYGWVDLVTCQPKDRLDAPSHTPSGAATGASWSPPSVSPSPTSSTGQRPRGRSAPGAARRQHHLCLTAVVLGYRDRDGRGANLGLGADDPETTGVALLMHGQPDAHQQTHAHFDIQENAFCNRVRMMLVEKGIAESNIRLCWMDWRAPDVTETVRHLAALGCDRILVVPACYPFDSMMTMLDLPMSVRQARVASMCTSRTVGVGRRSSRRGGTSRGLQRLRASWTRP